MLGLIKNLKIMFNMQVQYMCCDTAGENVALKSMQIGRAGVRLWLYCPRYATTKWLHQMVIHYGYSAKIVNIETAFLYGKIEEKIYMECPRGISNIGKTWLFKFK